MRDEGGNTVRRERRDEAEYRAFDAIMIFHFPANVMSRLLLHAGRASKRPAELVGADALWIAWLQPSASGP